MKSSDIRTTCRMIYLIYRLDKLQLFSQPTLGFILFCIYIYYVFRTFFANLFYLLCYRFDIFIINKSYVYFWVINKVLDIFCPVLSLAIYVCTRHVDQIIIKTFFKYTCYNNKQNTGTSLGRGDWEYKEDVRGKWDVDGGKNGGWI